jgi:3-deoxy-manno-octulosonate cytidylyltransferase (CMP-KDO synthetase)
MGGNASVVAIIPARYESTRLPGKPLVDVHGLPLIYHVYKRVIESDLIDDVIIATDDVRIEKVVHGFGGHVVMTSKDHATGTDRVAAVASQLDTEIIINIQGDEIGIDPESVTGVVTPLLQHSDIQVSNLIEVLDRPSELINSNVVKVVLDQNEYILYYSRSPIPYPKSTVEVYYRQVGVYAFRRESLLRFADMPQSPLEVAESIEFLRLVENGWRIKAVISKQKSFDIDTVADLVEARRRLSFRIDETE